MNNIIAFRGYNLQLHSSYIKKLKTLKMRVPVTVLDFNHTLKRHIHALVSHKDSSLCDVRDRLAKDLKQYQIDAMWSDLKEQVSSRDEQLIVVINIPWRVDVETVALLSKNIHERIVVFNDKPTIWQRFKDICHHLFSRTNRLDAVCSVKYADIPNSVPIGLSWDILLSRYCDEKFRPIPEGTSKKKYILGTLMDIDKVDGK